MVLTLNGAAEIFERSRGLAMMKRPINGRLIEIKQKQDCRNWSSLGCLFCLVRTNIWDLHRVHCAAEYRFSA
jgi:hypothetical protein